MEKQIFTNVPFDELADMIKDCVKQVISNQSLIPKKENLPEELLSFDDLIKIFNVSKVTLHKWKKKGLLPFYKMNRRVYFKRSEVINSMNHKKRKMEV